MKFNSHRSLSIADLQAAPAYQRTVIQSKCRKMAKTFNADAFGVIVVGWRNDETMWVVDGLQRMTAAALAGHKRVPCSVFESRGPKHEAEVFLLLNANRTPITPLTTFNAGLTMGDQEAVHVARIVKRRGFKIPRNSGYSWPNIQAIVAVKNIYKQGSGQHLERVLELVQAHWAERKCALDGTVLMGLGCFLAQYPDADETRINDILADNPPKMLKNEGGLALGAAAMTGARHLGVTKVLVTLYNKGLRKNKKLA